ncbi:MAG: SDR family oxidoreductase [Chitinophagaceae bacterium]|nr:SDR family oxidoreductase [Chitinophagaceae bacterium]
MASGKHFDLSGKRAVVTGGSKGLGRAITAGFIEYGAEVIITGRNQEDISNTCKELGSQCKGVVFDLKNIDGIPAFVDQTEAAYGKVDILVNNAGIHLKKNAVDVSDEEYNEVILVNQRAVFSLSREWAKKMLARKAGSILMISSMASQYGIPKVIAYTAAKSAIEGMTRALAVELSPYGIRVNCIAPGFIETEMSSKALNGDPERKQKILSRTPMQKLGAPADVAMAALYLCSPAAAYVTGIVLPVDGGNSIGF